MTTVYLAPTNNHKDKNTLHFISPSIVEDVEFLEIVSQMMNEEDYYGEFNFY